MKKEIKFISEPLMIISSFDKRRDCNLYYQNKSFPAFLYRNSKGQLYLEVGARFNKESESKLLENIELVCEGQELRAGGFLCGWMSSFGEENSFSVTIKINEFSEADFDQDKTFYIRKIIPIALHHKISFFSVIKSEAFYADNNYCYPNKTVISLQDYKFDVYYFDDIEKQYLIIDCVQEIKPKDFSQLTWSILVGLGYVVSHLPQNEEFSFYYEDAKMRTITTYRYRVLRPSYRSIVAPISANPSSWISSRSEKNLSYNFEEVSYKHLSTLCDIIHRENEIKAIIILVVESLSRSMLLMPAGLSVALEGLSTYFYDRNEEIFRPITDSKDDKEFRKELQTILKKYSVKESFKGIDILRGKIDQINRPTNADKLEAPFKILNIPLSKVDKEVLKYRNAFLHGNITLHANKKEFKMKETEVANRLYTLINCIIFKMIGFTAPILNQAKIQSQGNDYVVNEDYVRVID